MIRLWRVFPRIAAAEAPGHGHPLWFPRELQGAGRHDNPDLYGAMYVSEVAVAAVAEPIAHLRGQRLEDADLERAGIRLALVSLDAAIDGRLWDLDDPRVLLERNLRPSQVATRFREQTRRQAADLFRARPSRDGLRWWSALEASWINVTLFERAARRLFVAAPPEPLNLVHPVVREAAAVLGMSIR
ncbi:MAG: RES domain-containing protein [Candidatus Binatia bacterium]